MLKKLIVSGLLGCVILVAWMFVVNAIFGFKGSIDRKQLPDERQVYEILKAGIVEPGRYICNPEPTWEGFPDGEPVFSILYGGVGHEFAGPHMLCELLLFFLAPALAAWMLSVTSERILSSYPRKVLFFVMIGLMFAIFDDLRDFGIGSYPLKDAFMLAVHDVVVWTLIGLVVAWWIRPEPGGVAHP